MASSRQNTGKTTTKAGTASKSKTPTKKATTAKKQSTSASAKKKRVGQRSSRQEKSQSSRLWLMYPTRLITKPIIWQLGRKFDMVTNVRQASVTGEIGIVCLELEGNRTQIDEAIKWLERQGIRVEPVEINVLDA